MPHGGTAPDGPGKDHWPVQGRDPDPIFILGITPRSGTNFLWDLLLLHPACGFERAPVWEDFFLQESDPLVAYVNRVRRAWDPAWGPFPGDLQERLLASLGEGLISFLWVQRDLRLVTKTPSVRNIGRFFALFPRARLLVLVRDGRSVAHSCMATFGWDLETAARRWATAADEVVGFHRGGGHTGRYRLVRYEDLVTDAEATMTDVLDFLDLDAGAYDFDAARALPVRGSSVHLGPGRTAVHWDPVDKDEAFDPLGRWRVWTPAMRERFDWLAGRQQRALGYEPASGRAVHGRVEGARHRLLDCRWVSARAARLAVFRTRGGLGDASRPLRRRLGLRRDR